MHDSDDLFVKVHKLELAKLLPLFRDRTLPPRDAAVLICLWEGMDVNTAKIRLTAAGIAEQLGTRRTDVVHSLSRLKRLSLLAAVKCPRTGECYYMLNPYLASVGAGKKWAWIYRQFQEALE